MPSRLKVWNGSAWVARPVKVWTGSAWVTKQIKFWNGSEWVGDTGGVIAAPVLRNKTSSNYPGVVGMIYVDKPAGTVENDIILVGIAHAKNTTWQNDLIPPAGFTRIGVTAVKDNSNFSAKLEVYWKRAGASEPANYGFDVWGSNQNEYYAASYSGCPTSGSPIDTFSQNFITAPTFSTTATGLSVTTTQANDKLIWLGHNWDASQALTPPAGMTEQRDRLLYVADETIAAAGATGDRTQTQASNNPWAVFLIALKGA